jgi:ADP-dependent NAD(P)H-hydrate dehydratase / NAD(P)H-hydrate epimerase
MKTVTAAQMRELDRRTIDELGVPGAELMERAGAGVARYIIELSRSCPRPAASVRLLAGGGNNGGDAFVAARHLHAAGLATELLLAVPPEKLAGDALQHFELMRSAQVPLRLLSEPADWARLAPSEESAGLLVDGLLGTGASGAPRGALGAAVDYINACRHRAQVLAIDIPSGLDADTGLAPGAAVRADTTLTMALPKCGLLMPEALDYVGRLEVIDIGIPEDFTRQIESETELLVENEIAAVLGKRRRRDAHKGDFGRVLIIGGAAGMSGAVVLAGRAALRMGAGLVTALVPRSIAAIIAGYSPELMVRAADETDSGFIDHSIWHEWIRRVEDFDAILIGPGLGRSESGLRLVRDVLRDCETPLVLDADAISVLEGGAHWVDKCRAPAVLTPHPGEMARFLMKAPEDLQSARWDCALEAAEQSGATIVLKGAGTCIAQHGQPLTINMNGNPGMATGGSGDVLGGMIAALIAQGHTPCDAARTGVYLHGLAGDRAARKVSEQALIAGDLIDQIPALLRSICAR